MEELNEQPQEDQVSLQKEKSLSPTKSAEVTLEVTTTKKEVLNKQLPVMVTDKEELKVTEQQYVLFSISLSNLQFN